MASVRVWQGLDDGWYWQISDKYNSLGLREIISGGPCLDKHEAATDGKNMLHHLEQRRSESGRIDRESYLRDRRGR